MLNDEHETVRERALQMVAEIDCVLGRGELETVLMALREKHTPSRRLVYRILPGLEMSHPKHLILVLERSLVALQSYKGDRKAIYRMLVGVGRRGRGMVGGVLGELRLPAEEPNWKNSSYKATMMLVYEWWRQGKADASVPLPCYFDRHMVYLADVESHLLERERAEEGDEETTDSMVDWHRMEKDEGAMRRYVEAEIGLSEGFHREVLEWALGVAKGGKGEQLADMGLKYRLGNE